MHWKTVVVAGVAGAAVCVAAYHVLPAPRLRDWLVERLTVRLGDGLRREMQAKLMLKEYVSPPGHSHGAAAAARTRASRAMKAFIRQAGYEPYIVSMSARDKEADGEHGHYMPRDILYPARCDPVTNNHIIMMVDVDYYVDMREWAEKLQPMLLYTFCPQEVAGAVDDGCYTIVDDEVHMYVNGGGEYRHRLWAYDSDWAVFHYWWGSLVYSVEQKQSDDYHRIVLLNPVAWVRTPLAWILLAGKPFGRRVFGLDGLNRIDSLRGNLMMSSVGVPGDVACATLPTGLLEAVEIRFQESLKPSIHTVERYLTACKEFKGDPVVAAPILFKLFSGRKRGLPKTRDLCCAVGQPVLTTYQCVGAMKDGYSPSEDGKEFGRVIAPHLVTETAVFPRMSRNNDVQCVRGRVIKPKNDVTPPSIYDTYAAEFVEMLVDVPALGRPWDVDDVWSNQPRPTQKARSELVWSWLGMHAPHVVVRAFMKKEAYGDFNDPRNISQVPTEQTLLLSTVTYAFKEEVLKKQLWYAPCKSPDEIAIRVSEYVQTYDMVGATDYSRFDGSISRWLALSVVRAAYMRWAEPAYREYVGSLLAAEYNAPGYTMYGVSYDAGFGTLSGSPRTTDGNTMINAFCCYAAHRRDGKSPRLAYQSIGLCAGDDGLNAASPVSTNRVGRDLGLSLKLEVSRVHEAVTFLSRVFIDPWTEVGSFQEPVRTLKKLTLSVSPRHVPIEVALVNRARGYLDLDPKAPVVATWCRRVLSDVVVDEKLLRRYVDECQSDRPYYKGWPQCGNVDLMYEVYALKLGITVEELLEIDRLIRVTPYSHHEPWINTRAQLKVQCTFTGDNTPLESPTDTSDSGLSSLPRRRGRRGGKKKV